MRAWLVGGGGLDETSLHKRPLKIKCSLEKGKEHIMHLVALSTLPRPLQVL